MKIDWSTIFDGFGIKMVSSTDKGKGAYVLNEEQRAALAAAGRLPEARATFTIDVLFDPLVPSIRTSYYNSVRAGSGRTPEARMGRGLIHWAQIGDQIVLGNKGTRVMAAKVNASEGIASDIGRELARTGHKRKIIRRAKQATGKPPRRTRMVTDFVRNPYVVAAALLRADGSCEMPACTSSLFQRDDGSNFLEVHHIIPLAEGGDDTVANAAALCPACHRELHHGVRRRRRRAALAAAVATKPFT